MTVVESNSSLEDSRFDPFRRNDIGVDWIELIKVCSSWMDRKSLITKEKVSNSFWNFSLSVFWRTSFCCWLLLVFSYFWATR